MVLRLTGVENWQQHKRSSGLRCPSSPIAVSPASKASTCSGVKDLVKSGRIEKNHPIVQQGVKMPLHKSYKIEYGRHFHRALGRYQSDSALMNNLHAIIADLAEGSYRGGMQRKCVKRTSDRKVYEIRLNAGDRLMIGGPFKDEASEEEVLYLYEFGRHDDIDSMIQRALGVSIEPSALEEDPVDRFDPAITYPPDLKENVTYQIPWAAYFDELNFGLFTANVPASLRLEGDQVDALSSRFPLLIQGQAGSGKTSILAHHLAFQIAEDDRAKTPPRRRLYLSFNEHLVKRARQDVEAIVKTVHGLDELPTETRFLSYLDFVRELIPNDDNDDEKFIPEHRVSWVRFRDGYCGKSDHKVSAELAWHGIRSYFKGTCIPPRKPPLSYEDYLNFHQRRLTEVDETQLKRLAEFSKFYHRWLTQMRFWDDLDLVWKALNWLNSSSCPQITRYYQIYCDEVQDFTELDFTLLLRLTDFGQLNNKPAVGLAVAGDPLQTIHPSGFRWEIVKDRIFYSIRSVLGADVSLQMKSLPQNFRSDGAIVNLANRIQQYRRRYVDETIPIQEARKPSESTPILGILPDEITSTTVATLLQKQPRQGIIVADEATKGELVAMGVEKDFIYTVLEAKGLEFDTALLWRLGEGNDDCWSMIKSGKTEFADNQRIPLLYFLNRIYVAVTRGIQDLFIFDVEEVVKERWIPLLGDSLEHHPSASLHNNPALKRATASRADWAEWAEQLRDREEFDRAAAYFREARKVPEARRCEAMGHRHRGEFSQAGDIFQQIGEHLDAADAFFNASLWERAYQATKDAPMSVRTRKLAARALYKWQIQEGNPEKAISELGNMVDGGGEQSHTWIRFLAKALRDVGQAERAGNLFLKINDLHAAAVSFVDAEQWQDALSAFMKIGSEDEGRYRAEGEVEAAAGNNEKAISAFRQARAWNRMLTCAEIIGDVDSSLHALKAMNRHDEVLTRLERELRSATGDRRDGLLADLLDAAAAAQDWSKAREAARELNRKLEEAEFAERAGEQTQVVTELRIDGYRKNRQWSEAAKLLREVGRDDEALEAEGRAFKKAGQSDRAAQKFRRLLYLRSLWESYRDLEARKSELAEEDIDDAAARRFFDLLPKFTKEEWKNLHGQKHVRDRRFLEQLIDDYATEFRVRWGQYKIETQTALLDMFSSVSGNEDLEIHPVAFVRHLLDTATSRPNIGLRRRLEEALEDLEAYSRKYSTSRDFSLQEIGKAWLMTGHHLTVANWFEAHINEGKTDRWLIEGAIEARTRQMQRAQGQEESKKANDLQLKIDKLKKRLAS